MSLFTGWLRANRPSSLTWAHNDYGVVIRDGEERRLRVHNNVPREFSVALSREDVVCALPIACPVEGMRDNVFGGTEERVHQGEIIVGSES